MIFVTTNLEYAKPDKKTGRSIRDKRVRDKAVRNKPARNEPVRNKPVRNKPVRDKPVRDKPVRDKPVRDKLVRDKPVRDKLVRDGRDMKCIGPPMEDMMCTIDWKPVLGCDGKMFPNTCTMVAAGVAYTHPEYKLKAK